MEKGDEGSNGCAVDPLLFEFVPNPFFPKHFLAHLYVPVNDGIIPLVFTWVYLCPIERKTKRVEPHLFHQLHITLPGLVKFAGVVGQTTAAIGGTPAANLESTIDTIQANIGFDELQAMRDASPTGGALGQVAIRELDMLQSTLASLKQKQSPGQLKSNLNKILGHYNNWLKSVNEAAVQEGGAPINPNETQPTQRKRIKFDAQGNIVK